MNYAATKIYLTCDQAVLDAWTAYMLGHLEEVGASLRQERVRHEMWFCGNDAGGLFIIGVMDVDDAPASVVIANASTLSVDQVHRDFKTHWDRARTTKLDISPSRPPVFENCILLFEARP